ncbi:LOW QUALITY PROTEIN: PIF1 domain-containing protein, partial [Cephalotus follicularis]
MNHKNCFEALDKSLRDVLTREDTNMSDKPFGEKCMLGCDFRQILLVVSGGSHEDIVSSSMSKSYLWKFCTVYLLKTNMCLLTEDEPIWIRILDDILSENNEDPINIAHAIHYNFDILFNNHRYLQERAIVTPTNDIVDVINSYLLSIVPRNEQVYLSSDSICKASTEFDDQ